MQRRQAVADTSKRPASRWGASYASQISILFLRAIKTRRFDSLSTQDIIQFIVVGVLSGAHYCPSWHARLILCRLKPPGKQEESKAKGVSSGQAGTGLLLRQCALLW